MQLSGKLLLCLLASQALAKPQSHDDARLLGGSPVAPPGQPFVALIQTFDVTGAALNKCGGAIINSTIVVTSAFCVYKALTVKVMAGDSDPASADFQTRDSQMIIIHPNFYKNSMINDIALIKVTKAFDIVDTAVNVIKLAPSKAVAKDKLAGLPVTIFGWGLVDDGTNSGTLVDATALQSLDLIVSKSKDCAGALKTVYYSLPSTAICGNTTLTKSICKDDWGGPAVAKLGKDTEYSLVGLSSQFVKCPTTVPNMFTSIVTLLKWISSDGGPTIK